MIAQLTEVVAEFLEVAVHTVLATRSLYHKDAFERCRIYGTFTRRSRHPELNSYISSTISRLKPLLEAGHLRELVVLFLDSRGRPLDRVTFRPELLVQGAGSGALFDDAAVQAALSAALLKLQFLDSQLKPLPQGSTFELVAYSSSRQGVDRQYFGEEGGGALELRQPVRGQAVKSVRVEGALQMQILAEESAPPAAPNTTARA